MNFTKTQKIQWAVLIPLIVAIKVAEYFLIQ